MKCPHCNTTYNNAKMESTTVQNPKNYQETFPAIVFMCPQCNSPFSVQIDPFVVKTELLTDLVKILRKPS